MFEQFGTAQRRPDLEAAFYGYNPDGIRAVAPAVLPSVPVDGQNGSISVVTRASMLKDASTSRGVTGDYNRVNLGTKPITYDCRDEGLEYEIPAAKQAQPGINEELAATRKLRLAMIQAEERRVAGLLNSGSTFTSGKGNAGDASGNWDETDTDVIADVQTAKAAIRDLTGVTPNTLVMNGYIFDCLMANEAILARFPGAAAVTEQLLQNTLAAIFGVQRILVSDVVYNSDATPDTVTIAKAWPDTYVQVCVTAGANAPLEVPCLGRKLFWAEDGSSETILETYFQDRNRVEVVRARNNQEYKLFDEYFGYLLTVHGLQA